MKLAYFSPLTPKRSGISDYSEELLPYLAEGADITLFVDGFKPANPELRSRFRIVDYGRWSSRLKKLKSFDAVVYHMGNDHRYHGGMLRAMAQRRGIVVFHDFALQDFFLGLARERNDFGVYLDEVEFCYGPEIRRQAADSLTRGVSPTIADQPLQFPLNWRLAKSAEGIVVHSSWQAHAFENLACAANVPIALIKHHITSEAAETVPGNIEGTKDRSVNIASFGLITPDKGIERAVRVLARLRGTHDFHYTLVGSASN